MELLLLLFPTMGRLKKKRKLRNLLIHGIKSLLTGRSKQDVLTHASLLAFETSGGRPTLQAAEPGGQGEIVMEDEREPGDRGHSGPTPSWDGTTFQDYITRAKPWLRRRNLGREAPRF